MGRWDGYGRRTVEQTRSISIGTLRRARVSSASQRVIGGNGAGRPMMWESGLSTGAAGLFTLLTKSFRRNRCHGGSVGTVSIFSVNAGAE